MEVTDSWELQCVCELMDSYFCAIAGEEVAGQVRRSSNAGSDIVIEATV